MWLEVELCLVVIDNLVVRSHPEQPETDVGGKAFVSTCVSKLDVRQFSALQPGRSWGHGVVSFSGINSILIDLYLTGVSDTIEVHLYEMPIGQGNRALLWIRDNLPRKF